MEDCLVITVDISNNDVPTLLVTRSSNDLNFKIVNQLWGDEATELYNKIISNKTNHENKKKRKYYRKCGVCAERYEQSEMIRTDDSPNGWVCWDCRNIVSLEYDD